MFTAEARIETERPSRYLVQLCQHIRHMGDPDRHLNHRSTASHGDEDERPQGLRIKIVEASDAHGVVEFAPWGRCTMLAESNVLKLRLESIDEENLRWLQEILTRNLVRFGRRDHLTVHWDGSETGIEPGQLKRKRHWPVLLGIILVKVAIIGVIVVLPSGLAISLGASHAVGLIVLVVVAAVTAIVLKLRGKPLRPAMSLIRHRGRR
jgi:hypothetical protein